MHGDAKAGALQSLDLCRQQNAIAVERAERQHRRRHGLASEKRRRHAIVGFLVGQHADGAAPAHNRGNAPRGARALGHVLATLRAAAALNQALDIGVVGPSVDRRERQVEQGRRQPGQLPVAQVRGENDAGLAALAHRIEVFQAGHLDTRVGAARFQSVEMDQLADAAAQVVPHLAHDNVDLGRRVIRESTFQVAARPAAEPQARAQVAGQEAAETGGGIERQQGEDAIEQPGNPGLQQPAQAAADRKAPGATPVVRRQRGDFLTDGLGDGGEIRPAAGTGDQLAGRPGFAEADPDRVPPGQPTPRWHGLVSPDDPRRHKRNTGFGNQGPDTGQEPPERTVVGCQATLGKPDQGLTTDQQLAGDGQ